MRRSARAAQVQLSFAEAIPRPQQSQEGNRWSRRRDDQRTRRTRGREPVQLTLCPALREAPALLLTRSLPMHQSQTLLAALRFDRVLPAGWRESLSPGEAILRRDS